MIRAFPAFDIPERVIVYVCNGHGVPLREEYFDTHTGIGFVDKNGDLQAGFIYHSYDKRRNSIEVGGYSHSRNWYCRKWPSIVMGYPFNQLDCRIVESSCNQFDNLTRRVWRGLGAKETLLEDMNDDGVGEYYYVLKKKIGSPLNIQRRLLMPIGKVVKSVFGIKDPPPPPDPIATAGAQNSQNVFNSIVQGDLGAVDQVTRDGSIRNTITGYTTRVDPLTGKTYQIPKRQIQTFLSPHNQALAAQNEATELSLANTGREQAQRLRGLLNEPVSTAGLPQRGNTDNLVQPNYGRAGAGPQYQNTLPNLAGNVQTQYGAENTRDRVEQALHDRLQPQLNRDRRNLETSLANQGIQQGSRAYSNALADYQRGVNDQRLAITAAGGQEQALQDNIARNRASFNNQGVGQQQAINAQNAGFANDTAARGYNDQLRQLGFNNQIATQDLNANIARTNAQNTNRASALQERFAERNQPLNEIAALSSGSQVNQPIFQNVQTPGLANTDVAGIINNNYAQQAANINSQNAITGDLISGLVGGVAGFAQSDKRLKKDIKKVAKTKNGMNLYMFKMKSGGPTQVGLMAQEVEKKRPGAVKTINGVKMVNYRKALK